MRYSAWAGCLVAIMLLWVGGCGDEPAPPEVTRPVRVTRVGDVHALTGRRLPGRAEANEEVDLSFRVSGPLVTLPVKVGQNVAQGDVLAQIDPREFDLRIRSIEGQLAANQAGLAQAMVELKKTQGLVAAGTANQNEADRWQARVDILKAERVSIQANLETAQDDLKYTQLRAPFSGRIAARYVENFQTVQAKEPILRLLDTSRVKVTVDVPEGRIGIVKYVTEVHVEFDALKGRRFPATIHEIGTEASATTRTYPVTLLVEQPDDAEILPGMTCNVSGKAELPQDARQDGFEVPPSAVVEGDDGKAAVWLVDEKSNTVKSQAVTLVRDRDLTAHGLLVKGLEPGQLIVTAGVHFLKEGQEVRVLPEIDETEPPPGSNESTDESAGASAGAAP